MYYVLYDRHLNSLGETYILESWSRTQRATDFDDMKIVGEKIPYWVDPFFVVINDRQGKQQFSGLASTPQIDEKSQKASLSLKDYTTLFNSEILIDWSRLPSENLLLHQYLDYVLSTWIKQTDVGFSGILWDLVDIEDIPWDTEFPVPTGWESVSVHSLVQNALSFYSLYTECLLDVHEKTLTFSFHPQGISTVDIRLRDFGIPTVEKSFGDINRITVYDSDRVKRQEWALAEDNSLVRLPSDKNLVYPAKNRIFIAEATDDQSVYSAVYDGVSALAQNRFQENIDIDTTVNISVVDLSSVDFRFTANVYTDGGFYKQLPVGEIETDSKGKRIIRLGLRVQEFTQGG